MRWIDRSQTARNARAPHRRDRRHAEGRARANADGRQHRVEGVTTDIRVGVSIPQTFPEGPIEPASIRSFVQRAEALDFDSLWVQESIVGRQRQLDSIELLTFAAACTERMRLGAAVLLALPRGRPPLAKTLVTLDHLSAAG